MPDTRMSSDRFLDIETVLFEKYPGFLSKAPALFRKSTLWAISRLFREKTIQEFLQENEGVAGLEFVEKVLDYFSLGYSVSNVDRENIPVSGRVVIFANHPLGALDALCLVKAVSEVRTDVKIVANDMLRHLYPMQPLLLPVDSMLGRANKQQLKHIQEALEREQAVIFFPAGEVSRARPVGVRDTAWSSGFLNFARRTGSPLLPCYIDARNSVRFYSVSAISKPAASLLLVSEMFRQKIRALPIKVGGLIPAHGVTQEKSTRQAQLRQLKRHLYRVGRGKEGLYQTEKAIAHPVPRKTLRQELTSFPRLGETHDGKHIYLVKHTPDSPVIKEIGRLRELSFRKVGEGTGDRRDIDAYDQHYEHIVLWDDNALEVVGAYRVKRLASSPGELYTNTLFKYEPAFYQYFPTGLELGRSFIQPAYWGTRALDYLWQGIGAYLQRNPDIRWLFGPVSISNAFPQSAIDLMIGFYSLYFPGDPGLVIAREPYHMGAEGSREIASTFSGDDYKQDFKKLKKLLRYYGLSVPPLYKKYADQFGHDGVQYLAWNIDVDFGNCIDGFLLADLKKLKESRRKRYLGAANEEAENEVA